MGEKLRSRRVVGVGPLAVPEGTKDVLHQGQVSGVLKGSRGSKDTVVARVRWTHW